MSTSPTGPYAEILSYQTPAPRLHSGLGIASFIIGAAVIVLSVLAIIIVAIIWPRGGSVPPPSVAITIGGTICTCLVAAVVGLVLGLISIFFPPRRRLYPFLGTLLNSLFLLGWAALVALSFILRAKTAL